jgi:hypothetical protein
LNQLFQLFPSTACPAALRVRTHFIRSKISDNPENCMGKRGRFYNKGQKPSGKTLIVISVKAEITDL